MKQISPLTRRQFIRRATTSTFALGVFPTIIPSSARGRDGAVAPSNRIVTGAIGVGDRGQEVLRGFLSHKDCQVLALADVQRDTLARVKGLVDSHYQSRDCATYHDFRELVARQDVDAILIASPDHWHVLHALAAVRAGKDIYLEKPMGLSLAEDQALRREVRRRERVFQFGTQQRSDRKFRAACELVRNGLIGQLRHVNVWCQASRPGGSTTPMAPPPELDFDFWLGPAPKRAYTQDLVASGWAKNWWYVSDFALGFIAGWGVHPLDIALWGAADRASGTVELQGVGKYPTAGISNTAVAWDVHFKFSTGLTMRFVSTPNGSSENFEQRAEWKARYRSVADHGTAFEGDAGWVRVDRGSLETEPENLLEIKAESLAIQLPRSADHTRNFLNAVKTRQATICPIQDAVQADTFCHLADIAARLGRKLIFDLQREKFIGDKEANRRLALRSMRAPWKL